MFTNIELFKENHNSNAVQLILPDMADLFNNGRMTQELASKLAAELSPETFNLLDRWFQQAQMQQRIKIEQAKRKF